MVLTVLPGDARRRREDGSQSERASGGRPLLVSFAVLVLVAGVGAQTTDWPRESPPSPLPARRVEFPPYQLRTLANGLQVLAIPHHEEPAVSFRLIIRAGATEEAPDRPGVASFVAGLLQQGTSAHSADQIATLFDSAGAIVGVGSAKRVDVHQWRGREGSGRSGARARVRDGPASGLCTRRDHASAQPGVVVVARELRRSGLRRHAGLRADHFRPASVRAAERWHAGLDRAPDAG